MSVRSTAAILIALCWTAAAQSDYATAATDVRNGQPERAIPALERILGQSPSDLKARNLLGIALMNAGRKEDARIQFQKALQIDPGFHAALKNLAIDEMALGQKADAARHFQDLLKAVPNDPVAHLYVGLVSHRLAPGAEESLDHLPPDAQMQFDAGLLLSQAGRFAAAARHFELARNGYQDRYQLGFNLTLVYVNGGDWGASIRTGEELSREHPTAELYNLISRAYESSGQTQKAYDALRSATKIDPRDERNYVDLMSLCQAHENWDLSLEISEVALANIPGAFRIRLQRGAVQAMQGRLADAGSEFAEAGRLAPQSSMPVVASALVSMEMKEPEKAIALLRARRKQTPKDYLVNWFLAEALVQDDSSAGEAIGALQDAVQSNPSAAGPRVLLGKLLARRGDSAGAIRQFEEALKLQPGDHTAAYQLAILYRKGGNIKRAEELMAIAAKATSAAEEEPAARQKLVRIIREASQQ